MMGNRLQQIQGVPLLGPADFAQAEDRSGPGWRLVPVTVVQRLQLEHFGHKEKLYVNAVDFHESSPPLPPRDCLNRHLPPFCYPSSLVAPSLVLLPHMASVPG